MPPFLYALIIEGNARCRFVKKMVHEELHRAFFNPSFIITLLLLLGIVLADLILTVNEYNEYLSSQFVNANGDYWVNPAKESFSLYNNWIGGEVFSFPSMLFYSLLPIFAALPFSWSYLSDLNSGYIRQLTIKASRNVYLVAKFIATYISGFLIIAIPLFLSVLLVACVIPAYKPNVIWLLYYSVNKNTPFSILFYNVPVLYLAIYLFIPSLFGGVFSVTSLSLSFIVRNKYTALFLPYIVMIIISHVLTLSFAYSIWVEISPLYFLKGTSSGLDSNIIVMGVWFLILLAFSLVTLILERRKRDVL